MRKPPETRQPKPPRAAGRLVFLATWTLALVMPACKRAPDFSSTSYLTEQRVVRAESLDLMRRETIGQPMDGPTWIAHVNAADLDRDGLVDVLACEARTNEVLWLKQTRRGVFEEQVITGDLKAPVHVEATDMDDDGDNDLLVSVMGFVFPNNDRIGEVVILENDGEQAFTPHRILENTYRVTDIRAADFNADGQMDLVVAQFGYDQGQVIWMERTGPWTFREHVLVELSGAINVCVDDFNGDARPDIVALVSQQWEEIYYFQNKGNGTFAKTRIWGSTNEDYGSSGISVSDLNKDGRPDILYSNGDGFGPSAVPGPRPWHGVQWFENTGNGYFQYHRVGDLPGAYSPVGVDLDGDGAMDIVAASAYADWERKGTGVVALMWFRNDGRMSFSPTVLAYQPRDQVTLTVGRFDEDDRPSLVTGGFPIFPPYEDSARITLWRMNQP